MARLVHTPPPVTSHATVAYQAPDDAMPTQLGRYQILGRLGAGGMGTVYHAHDTQLRRDVAIKVPRFDGQPEAVAAARQRFLREARAAAAVRHAHVCPIYDVSEHDGRPYVVMALVEGCSLAERLKAGPFADCREAVTLVCQVAEALAAVHAAGVIHRDLKPANILLDRNGQALLTDFGLARAERGNEHLTGEGDLLGTPAYMAPEQVEPEFGAVGPWSDQYSLAVVLYQMLTARLPFEGSTMSLLHQIATKTPPPPSQFRAGLDAELEKVLLKAMARRPQDRYPRVAQVRTALLAWRDKQPVVPAPALPVALPVAQPLPPTVTAAPAPLPTVSPRRRRPWWAMIATAAALLIGGLIAAQILLQIVDKNGKTIPSGNAATTGPDNGENGQPGVLATLAKPVPPIKDDEPLSPFALVNRPAQLPGVKSWDIQTVGIRGRIHDVAFRPNSNVAATAGGDGVLRLWDTATGKLLRVFEPPLPELLPVATIPSSLVWTPDGKHLTWGLPTGNIYLVDGETGATSLLHIMHKQVVALAWSADGRMLAVGVISDNPVRVWDSKIPGWLPTLRDARPSSLAFSPDGKTLVTGGTQMWDLQTGELSPQSKGLPEGDFGPHAVAWSPDGKLLAVGGKIWDPESGTTRGEPDYRYPVQSARWSADGNTLLYFSPYSVTQVEAATGKRVSDVGLQRAENVAAKGFLSLGGKMFVGHTPPFSPAFWDVATGKRVAAAQAAEADFWWALSPDGRRLATTSHGDNTLRLWDAALGKRLATALAEDRQRVQLDIYWSSDSHRLAGVPGVYEGDSLRPVAADMEGVWSAAWSPDARLLAVNKTIGDQFRLDIRDASDGRVLRTLTPPKQFGRADVLAWSPDGKRLVAACLGRAVYIFDAQGDSEPVRTEGPEPYLHGWPCETVVWSPDGTSLAVAGTYGVYVCDSGTGKIVKKGLGGAAEATGVAFSPDGKLLAGSSIDGVVHIWDVASWKEVRHFALPSYGGGRPQPLVWANGDQTLAVGRVGTVQFLEAATGARRGLLVPLWNGQGVALAADGNYRGTPGMEREIVYIVQTDKGQETLTPEEFATRFKTNDPERVRLTGE
jgi:serine/threonine protein kinase/WD40 repeat protein